MTRKHQPEVDTLEILDRVLTAALREVRELRARAARAPGVEFEAPKPSGSRKRVSQPAMCLELLKAAGQPLHISVLLAALAERGVQARKESLASALTKQVAPMGPFIRAGRNVFGLAGRDERIEG
jgi:hypothetical protein